jgi:uncharacterized protein YdeI (YjbR/CyaY-like superfamily)
MNETNPKVDTFLKRQDAWQDEMAELRKIALSCELSEVMKWGQPCYVAHGGNIVLIHGFKTYCAYLFLKGALMKDPDGILVQQTENVQSARQIRFAGVSEIASRKAVLKRYIQEAIEVEKAGLKVEYKTAADFEVPEEFQAVLEGQPAVKKAFEALSPGRRKAYLLHFAAAKQAKTRLSRIEKHVPRILEGQGLDD